MTYQCVNARFLFFNGMKRYTVEYAYGLCVWFVFDDEETRGALWSKKINPAHHKSPNRDKAESILDEYLETTEKQESKQQ